jgi:DNA-binding MarR family transcriptional regulator
MGSKSEEVHGAIESLQRLAELFGERRRVLAREAGLTETQWRVLEEVAGEDFMPSLFAEQRSRTPAAVSRTLRQLLDQALVEASIGVEDGRQRVYRLTPRGRRALQGLRRRRARAVAAVWESLPADDLRRFRHFADQLSQRLEAYSDS